MEKIMHILYTNTHNQMFVCVCIYICIYMCVYVCIYIYIYIHTHIFNLSGQSNLLYSFTKALQVKMVVWGWWCWWVFLRTWITFKPKVVLWICWHWPWSWTITQIFHASATTSSDKWNRFCQLPHTNNAFGLLVVLPCRAERTIFLLILKDKNALVFPLLIQSVLFFLLWVKGFVKSVGHYKHWLMKASKWFRTSVFSCM